MNRFGFLVGALLVAAMAKDSPPIPKLAQSFVSNIEFYVPQLAPPHFGGKMWVDYVVGGGKVEVNGEQFFPVYMESNFIATPIPNTDLIELYIFRNNNCFDLGNFSNTWLDVFPLQIPADALFAGNETTPDGLKAGGWIWTAGWDYIPWALEMWVNYMDNSVASFMAPFLNFDMHKTIVEHIDPSIYAKPNLTCPGPPPFDMKTWKGGLTPIFNMWERIYSPVQVPEEKQYRAGPVGAKKVDQQPPVPNLPQQFMTAWAQYVVDSNGTPWPFASGDFAIDNKLGGVKFNYGGSAAPDISPMYFELTGLVAPTDGNVTGYMYGRDICWLLGPVADKNWLQVFPLKIPDAATFMGNVTCREKEVCSSWTWQEDVDIYGNAYLEAWVPYEPPIELARFYVNASVVDYGGNTYYDFSNTKIGPVNPSVFTPPPNLCVPLDESPMQPVIQSWAGGIKKKMNIHK